MSRGGHLPRIVRSHAGDGPESSSGNVWSIHLLACREGGTGKGECATEAGDVQQPLQLRGGSVQDQAVWVGEIVACLDEKGEAAGVAELQAADVEDETTRVIGEPRLHSGTQRAGARTVELAGDPDRAVGHRVDT